MYIILSQERRTTDQGKIAQVARKLSNFYINGVYKLAEKVIKIYILIVY